MLRPSPNHGTQRLPNDDDDDEGGEGSERGQGGSQGMRKEPVAANT